MTIAMDLVQEVPEVLARDARCHPQALSSGVCSETTTHPSFARKGSQAEIGNTPSDRKPGFLVLVLHPDHPDLAI